MENDSTNKGSFEVINAIGKGKRKPMQAEPEQPQLVRRLVDVKDDAELDEMQERYLWECTFEVI